jgi:hypothetical protein
VWSDWGERWHIYLCQRQAWVARKGKPVVCVQSAGIGPPARLLAQLTSHLQADGKTRGQKLTLALGSSWAMPVGFAVPAGARWSDALALAQRSACQQWGLDRVDVERLTYALDPFSPGAGAAMAAPTWDLLQQWAKDTGLHLVSAQPMWSMATRWAVCRQARTVLIEEPDGITRLEEREGALQVSTSNMLAPDSTGDVSETLAPGGPALRLQWQATASSVVDARQAWQACFKAVRL